MVATIGSFTVDAAAAASGAVTLTTVTAGGNATISMGAGTGALAVTNITAGGNITVDAGTFGGAIDITNMSASGAGTVSVGSSGDFSAGQVNVNSTFTLTLLLQPQVRLHLRDWMLVAMRPFLWVQVLAQ